MYDTFEDRSRALLDSYIDKLAYLRDDPALTPMDIEERDFIEYQKNRPVPGTVLDPQKLDLQEYAVQPEYYENPRTGLLMATIPSGPNTPLPTPGWNPSMIKPPGNPNFRPTPTYDRIGPNGERIPYGPLV